jgi:hypothetical protein
MALTMASLSIFGLRGSRATRSIISLSLTLGVGFMIGAFFFTLSVVRHEGTLGVLVPIGLAGSSVMCLTAASRMARRWP